MVGHGSNSLALNLWINNLFLSVLQALVLPPKMTVRHRPDLGAPLADLQPPALQFPHVGQRLPPQPRSLVIAAHDLGHLRRTSRRQLRDGLDECLVGIFLVKQTAT